MLPKLCILLHEDCSLHQHCPLLILSARSSKFLQPPLHTLPVFLLLPARDRTTFASCRAKLFTASGHAVCALQGITDRRQLLDLTHRACTKRYILYMHKMNKRENVRAAVDLHCLGLTYPQLHAANAAQYSAAAESELSHDAAAFAAAMSSLPAEPCQTPGPKAAGHFVPGTLAGLQVSAEAASLSHGHESPAETGTTRRSARLQSAFGAAAEVVEFGLSPSAGMSQSSAAHADCKCPAMTIFVSDILRFCRPPSRVTQNSPCVACFLGANSLQC